MVAETPDVRCCVVRECAWAASRRPAPPAPPATATDTARFTRHRTIFISDTHLGTRGCKAEALADFLAHNDCATLFWSATSSMAGS